MVLDKTIRQCKVLAKVFGYVSRPGVDGELWGDINAFSIVFLPLTFLFKACKWQILTSAIWSWTVNLSLSLSLNHPSSLLSIPYQSLFPPLHTPIQLNLTKLNSSIYFASYIVQTQKKKENISTQWMSKGIS